VPNNVKTVDGKQTAAVQNFSVVYSGYEQHSMLSLVWLLLLVVVVAFGAFGYIGARSRRLNFPTIGHLRSAPATVGSSTIATPAAPIAGNLIDSVNGLHKPQPGSTIAPLDGHVPHDQDHSGEP
jgi:hypothetical protein